MPSFILNTTSTASRSLSNGDIGLIDTAGVLQTSGTAVTMAGGSDLYNLGVVRTTNTASGTNAITISGSGAMIENRGSIRGGTGAGSDAIEFNAAGRATTNLLLTNSGDIRGFASSGSAIALSTGGSVINNTGTIRSASFNAISISDLNGGASGTRITNSGTISADLSGRNAILIINNDTDRLDNAGQINGRVEMGGGNDVVTNSGFINGNLIMGAGDDLVTNTGNIGFTQGVGFQSFAHILLGTGNDTIDCADSDVRVVVDGGAGDDVYIIGAANASVVEEHDVTHVDSGGNDRVEAFVDFFLNGLANNVETLTLRGSAVVGSGGSIANTINGNELNNALRGEGGNDTLNGNEGNDTLTGGQGADLMNGGSGLHDVASYSGAQTGLRADLAFASTNTNDAAGDSYVGVEDLLGSGLDDVLAGDTGSNVVSGSSGNDAVFGREGADTVLGGEGADSLFGGTGNDVLTGGAGADFFVFDTALAANNVDAMTDFVIGFDRILLQSTVFTGLADGELAAGAFAAGTAATQADDRILYDRASGRIRFDADGVGGAASVLFATVNPDTNVTVADFFIL